MDPLPALIRDIFQWEVRSWSRALPLWTRCLPSVRPLKALAIGEREGGLSLWLATSGIDVVCTDLRAFPAATKELHHRHGVQHLITYAQADATALQFADGSFDVVIFKSVIGALGTKEKQILAIQEMHRVLRSKGVLLFAENLHGTTMHRWLRKRFVSWDSYWRYLDPVVDRDLFAPFSALEEATTGFVANLGRTEAQRDLIARMDGGLAPIIPNTWNTIWYGAAMKA